MVVGIGIRGRGRRLMLVVGVVRRFGGRGRMMTRGCMTDMRRYFVYIVQKGL